MDYYTEQREKERAKRAEQVAREAWLAVGAAVLLVVFALLLGALIGLVICSVLAILTPHVGVIP